MPAAWKDGGASKPDDFRNLVVKRRDACVKFKDGQPAKDRQEALQFYRGDNLDVYGESGDGLSTVVSRDLMEAVESVKPPLIRPFVAGEEVVSFEPIEKNDTPSVEQATVYVNHVFRRHNDVLTLVNTSLTDGLLFREGIAKTVVEECEDSSAEEFAGLTEEAYLAKRLELAEQGRDVAEPVYQDPDTQLYTVKVPPTKAKHYKVHIIAPDEFLREERLVSLRNATFLGHSKQMLLADIIELGVEEAVAKALGSGRPDSEERDARFQDEGESEKDDWDTNDLSRPVWVDECYIKTLNDGVMEWRKVLLGGSQSKILSDEAVEGHPYSHWTPIPLPHKLTGLSYHDLIVDIQTNKTAVQREVNNAMYLANRPQRAVLVDQVNMDDLMKPALDGVVRVKQLGALEVIPSGGERIFAASAQMIEYLDSVREARTGVTRYNQGMDSNSLNKTATGMNIIASNSQQRQELVARHYGEFLRNIFERILVLVTANASKEDVERVTGKPFVPWPTKYDTNVSVGLGTNNKDQLVGHLMALSQMYERVIQLQGGLKGPLVTETNVFEVLKRLPEAMGLKGDFFTDPAQAEMQQQEEGPPQPDPTKVMVEDMRGKTAIGVARIKQETEMAKQQPGIVPVPVPVNDGYGDMIDPNMGAM